MLRSLVIFFTLATVPGLVSAQATQPASDAYTLYMQAAKILQADDAINICSPSASNLEYEDYPPMPPAWLRMEKQDYERHAAARALVHEAAAGTEANWPPFVNGSYKYLDEIRNLANEIGDAALYQGLILKNKSAAFLTAGDLWQMTESLKNQPGETTAPMLAGIGMQGLDIHHLMVITSSARITEDASDIHDLSLSTATQWIVLLLHHPSAQVEMDSAFKGERAALTTQPSMADSLGRFLLTIKRVQVERDMLAMSLAAHIYQQKHGDWPANLQELATELPALPIDPAGDGRQTLGYVLIKGALPDGSDRPLVYSRLGCKDGLFVRKDVPLYSYYRGDGSERPRAKQKQGGQFRDVASWAPEPDNYVSPTTRPVE